MFAAIRVIPFVWSLYTVISAGPAGLPSAYPGDNSPQDRFTFDFLPGRSPGQSSGAGEGELVDYLMEHTQDIAYLAAVPDSRLGSRLVLETGRPVPFLGGFAGMDAVVDAEGLSRLVDSGRLRYVLYGEMRRMGGGGSPGSGEMRSWLAENCRVDEGAREVTYYSPGWPGMGEGLSLYRCGG